MQYVIPKNHLTHLLILGVIALLAACSSSQIDQTPAVPTSFEQLAAVTLEPDDSEAGLEARHGGEVILFEKPLSFAILGFSAEAAAHTTLELEPNQDTFNLPEFDAQGVRAWAGGVRAWAGGVRAWAGGVRAWAGGLASGTPLENEAIWEQIELYKAHETLAPNLGKDVVVAVIDTGLDLAHPVFTDRLVDGYDFIDHDDRPQDEGTGTNYGHGTAVAGVILQVAPQAKIMPLRVLDADGVGDTDDLVLAISWALKHRADVINLSLGSAESSRAVEKMLKKAVNKKVAVIASSGNSGDRNVLFPANRAYDAKFGHGLVSVGSVGSGDIKSEFSTYGKGMLETVAPGEAVFTTYPDEQVITWSGTSFAAPMVSGALALALGEPSLSVKSEELPHLVTEWVSKDLYEVPENSGEFKDELGKGRLDLEAFLEHVLDVEPDNMDD